MDFCSPSLLSSPLFCLLCWDPKMKEKMQEQQSTLRTLAKGTDEGGLERTMT